MKRILLLLLVIFMSMPANAMVIDTTKDGNIESHINKIGFNILNCNKIPYRITFSLNRKKDVLNAYSSNRNMGITIYQGIVLVADNDDEIAGVLSHEISHSVESYQGLFRGFFSGLQYYLSTQKYELKADKMAVDYMVNAGYNPLALLTMYSKIMSQQRYDTFSSHPLSSKRMMYIYEYIYNKYPAFLANNEYENNIYYQNFLLTSAANRKKFQEKIETKSKKKVVYE